MDNFSPTNFSRLIDNNRSLRRNRSNDEIDPEESLNSEEEEVAFEKWNPDVETVNINWKGWKRSEHPKLRRGCRPPFTKIGTVLKLSELAAKCVAMHIPFEMVEKFQPPVPEELQQRITFWSFPEWDDDICLYTCLANSNDDEFLRGEILFENGNVYDVIQIGFHLNATVGVNNGEKFSVSISFDRRRITSCICTCKAVPLWCCHIVAVCLLRIYNPGQVQLRPPISESLTRLNRDQLQKFSQYLVSSLPEQYLQTAQRLLDDLNSGQPLPINLVCGAPDTTAGASVHEYAMWCLDDHQLHLNVKKQMNRFGNIPPMVFSDVNMLTNNIPAIINEYNSMLRPLKIGEPDSLWNLLSIVRDMYRKNDRNALPLLEIITDEMTNCVQIILWWFANKSGLNGDCGYQIKYYYNGNSNSYIYQASAARLCDEIVSLWRLAALNPAITPKERVSLKWKFKDWHFKIIDLIWNNWKQTPSAFDLYNFAGFKPCVEACKLAWNNFPLPGITYSGNDVKRDHSWMYDCHPFTLGIDVKKLNCIKGPTETLQTALNSCFIHVERIRNTVSRVLGDSIISSDLPDYRTIKYLKEHFSSSRDEIFRFVAHLITMVDTWVNDECDDNDITLACLDLSSNDKHATHSKTIDNYYYDAVIQSCIDDLREKKLILEGVVISEIRKKTNGSSMCTAPRQCSNFSFANVERLDDTYELYNLEWEVYDSVVEEYEDDNIVSTIHGVGCSAPLTFFDTRHLPTNLKGPHNAIFETFSDMDDIWQSLIIRAEGLWAFGHTREACYIVRKVAENIISRPPDLKVMCSGAFVKPKRRKGQAVINPTAHRLTFMAVEKMELYKFLLNILASSPEHYDVAFKIGLLSLELPRAPASIKPLEVKLFHLENDIADILRKIPLTDEQYKILRTRLEKLKTGSYKARGPKLLPNALTSYILDVTMTNSLDGKSRSVSKEINETLCFEAALSSLSLKPDVCEFEHSLLVEGLRRQRCDLALRMLDLYKDEPKKVFKIMDVIIDQEIDVNMKRPLHLWFYQEKTKQEERLKTIIEKHKKKKKKLKSGVSTCAQPPQHSNPPQQVTSQSQVPPPPPQLQLKKPMNYQPSIPSSQSCMSNRRRMNGVPPPPQVIQSMPLPVGVSPAMPNTNSMNMIPFIPNRSFLPPNHPRTTCTVLPHRPHHFSPTSPNLGSVPNGMPNTGQMRFPPLLHPARYPFAVPPHFPRPPNGYPCGVPPRLPPSAPFVMKTNIRGLQQNVMSKHGTQRNGMLSQKTNKNSKCGKTGCKRPVSIVYRNRSTEALAHSMTELAKSVLFRSGGHLASSFYVRDSETGSVKTPNHVLHMCALQLAMYGLGISNNASSAWESRSYSPHVAMLTSLAIDIGAPALMFIIENWPGHLTPGEANSLADRGSRSENPVVQNLAARLALSCLSYADKLTSHEIIQAINQCRNLGLDMQEKACCEIEKVAKSHSLQSDVLFYVSKLWYNIYAKDEPDEVEEPKNVKASTNSASSRCSMPALSHFTIYRPASTLSGQSKSSSVLLNEVKVLKRKTYYLLASYRLSMMAFQNLSGDINEEKAHYRFHCLPNYTNDVYRTMQIAKLLGDKWVHHFCMVIESTLVNPFLLYEVACSASLHFARCNPSALHYIMSTLVKNLINKCEAMFFLYLHNKLYNMAQYEEEEFINMAQLAHKAFSVSADGPYRYQEWLQSLRSNEGSVRDLYMKITKAIEQEERLNKHAFRENDTSCKETILPFHHDSVKFFPDNKLKEDEDEDEDEDDDEDDDDDDDDEEEDNDNEEDDDEDGNEDDDDDSHSLQMMMEDQQPGPSGENRGKCNNNISSTGNNKDQNVFMNRRGNSGDDNGDNGIDRIIVLGLNSSSFLNT